MHIIYCWMGSPGSDNVCQHLYNIYTFIPSNNFQVLYRYFTFNDLAYIIPQSDTVPQWNEQCFSSPNQNSSCVYSHMQICDVMSHIPVNYLMKLLTSHLTLPKKYLYISCKWVDSEVITNFGRCLVPCLLGNIDSTLGTCVLNSSILLGLDHSWWYWS